MLKEQDKHLLFKFFKFKYKYFYRKRNITESDVASDDLASRRQYFAAQRFGLKSRRYAMTPLKPLSPKLTTQSIPMEFWQCGLTSPRRDAKISSRAL